MAYTPDISWPHISHPSGTQELYYFKNGFGASVICNPYTYGGDKGLFEIAVLTKSREPDPSDPLDDGYDICDDTTITDDVLGLWTPEGVQEVLAKIEALHATL
jgi:hypothetical protein